jgi:hypothetical protein
MGHIQKTNQLFLENHLYFNLWGNVTDHIIISSLFAVIQIWSKYLDLSNMDISVLKSIYLLR